MRHFAAAFFSVAFATSALMQLIQCKERIHSEISAEEPHYGNVNHVHWPTQRAKFNIDDVIDDISAEDKKEKRTMSFMQDALERLLEQQRKAVSGAEGLSTLPPIVEEAIKKQFERLKARRF